MTEREWLDAMMREFRHIILRINDNDLADLFVTLRTLFDTPITSAVAVDVKNLIASLVVTDPKLLVRRVDLQNAIVQRIMQARQRILEEPK